MRKFSRLAATAMAVAALGTTTAAQGRGAGKAPTTKAPSVGTSAPKGGGPSTHGSSSTKAGATGKSATTTKASGSAHGASKKPTTTTASTSASTSDGSSTTTTAGTTTAATTFEPNAISTKISKNPGQLAKVNAMLLTTGMSIEEASAGFRNQGQFIAALNVSKNQNIDFVQLKDAMTIDGLSLGQAAKQIRTAPPAPETTETPETGSTTSVSVSASNGSTTVSGSTTTTSGTTTAQTAK